MNFAETSDPRDSRFNPYTRARRAGTGDGLSTWLVESPRAASFFCFAVGDDFGVLDDSYEPAFEETKAVMSWLDETNPVLILALRAGSLHVSIPLSDHHSEGEEDANSFRTADDQV